MKIHLSAAGLALLLAASACSSDQPTESVSADLGARVRESRDRRPQFVATATNATDKNEIIFFPRNDDGTLGEPIRFETGGTGSGGGLGNQAGIAVSEDATRGYVVNAGSNTISAFGLRRDGMIRRQVISSGGIQPISIALSGDLLYVLNDGGVANITGFRVRRDGTLSPIAGSTRPLSVAAPDAAQIGFSRSSRSLIVTEKATNMIVTFRLDRNDRPLEPIVNTSSGATPFGFYVDERRGEVIVSEAFGGAPNSSAVSSYNLRGGRLRTISASVPTTETAACWIALSGDGNFAYTSNTASNTISGYAISRRGELTLLRPDGVDGVTGAGPIDLATREGVDFLYSLNRPGGSISIFKTGSDGALTLVGTVAGIPTSANGLITF